MAINTTVHLASLTMAAEATVRRLQSNVYLSAVDMAAVTVADMVAADVPTEAAGIN